MNIYKITNKINNKCYIGMIVKAVKDRYKQQYSKVKKCWLLNGNVIDIQNYTNPVSTISVSGE